MPVTLIGDPTLHEQRVSIKTFSVNVPVSKAVPEMELKAMDGLRASEEELPPMIAQKLQEYEEVFQKPVGLPPVRGREHAIVLQENSKPVSVRPYRYPQAYKKVMEKMVKEMMDEGLIWPSQSPFSSPVLSGEE